MSLTRSTVIYARISRDPANRLEGVAIQVDNLIAKVAERPDVELNTRLEGSIKDRKHPELGYWPPGVFVDNDISSRKGGHKRRPEYDRMMRHVRDGDATCIAARDPFRIWRNPNQTAKALEDLRDTDLLLIFLKFTDILTVQTMGRFLAQLMSLLGQLEADLDAERQQDATPRAAKRGAYHGARPFGFQLGHANPDGSVHPAPKSHDEKSGFCEACHALGRDKVAEYKTLIPDPTEAVAVREAYEMIAGRRHPVRGLPVPRRS